MHGYRTSWQTWVGAIANLKTPLTQEQSWVGAIYPIWKHYSLTVQQGLCGELKLLRFGCWWYTRLACLNKVHLNNGIFSWFSEVGPTGDCIMKVFWHLFGAHQHLCPVLLLWPNWPTSTKTFDFSPMIMSASICRRLFGSTSENNF